MTRGIEERTCKATIFVKDGRWIVPPEERPKNWERFGLLEVTEQAGGMAITAVEPTRFDPVTKHDVH
jgi:hypothetical protein